MLTQAFGYNMLSAPAWLLLIVVALVLMLFELGARPAGSFSISTGEVLARFKGHRKATLRRLPAVLRFLGLVLLIVALARPLKGLEARRDRADVIDIMLCLDVSGSMLSQDFRVRGRRYDRLSVAKEAIQHFLNSRKGRKQDRFGMDRVGMVPYAAYAWTQVPLTLDYGLIEHELAGLTINPRDERAKRTAIGSALGLAVRRLSKSEADSKVIILLTDGNNNSGQLDPLSAARVAKDYNIRVYTIGAGSPGGGLTGNQSLFGQFMAPSRGDPLDEDILRRIAEATGGRYYRATDKASLDSAYAEINELETTEIEIGDYYEFEEGFSAYALTGGVLILLALITRRLWFETIP